jgi:hypothetical protein
MATSDDVEVAIQAQTAAVASALQAHKAARAADNSEIRRRLELARDEAQTKALDSLGRYKFEMFGYHSSAWVRLNRIIGDGRPNPFRHIVKAARADEAYVLEVLDVTDRDPATRRRP